jgi:tetratricopeptide (TPR) repeat protein
MRRAVVIIEQAYGAEHPRIAMALHSLGELLRVTNRLAEAEPLMRRALGITGKSHGAEHPDVATCLNNLAKLLWQIGRPAEAEPLSRRAIAIFETSLGVDHPSVAAARSVMTRVLRATDRGPNAVLQITRAIRILALHKRQTGEEHPLTGAIVTNFRETLSEINLPSAEIDRRLAEAFALQSPSR